jgi:DNA-binding MarR family transcriptional regulator
MDELPKRHAKRAALTAALEVEFRELSSATIMFHQAVADRLGMNVTDHKCAGILAQAGRLTAGELAERTGLTTGAITGVIDRLERAGFARRIRDPHDRRRVIVEPILERMEERIVPLFVSMARASAELCKRYSLEELAVIQDFTMRARAMAYEEARKLRTAGASDGNPRRTMGKKRAGRQT